MIWGWFAAASATVKLVAVGSIVIAAVIGSAIIYHRIWERGYVRALSDIATQDAKAIGKATEYRNTWRVCRDAGRVWDQSTGKCSGG